MVNNSISKKDNGIYYTPVGLALHLARPLISGKKLSVFDPAYGEGSLLLASEYLAQHENTIENLSLYGCDLHPVNGLLQHLPIANLIQKDFFEYNQPRKFDVVLTNPPYIRHQKQEKKVIRLHRANIPELSFLSNASDLWAYFLVKSVTHLKKNGSIGAILPWAFIQADYAKKLRIWLTDQFSEIKVLALRNEYFDNAQERVVLLWLTGLGHKNKSISLAFSNDFGDHSSYSILTRADWESNRIVSFDNDGVISIMNRLKTDFQFCSFRSCAKAHIGIVTGANKYFIRDLDYCYERSLLDNNSIPILTNAKEMKTLLSSGPKTLSRLIQISEKEACDFKWFIDEGEKAFFHERSHSKLRHPWYSIKQGKVPDAFFPYRVGKIPYLILNDHKIQSTNSIHRVYFNELCTIEKKWVFVSMLSIYSQLSISINSKTYGRGMLKIEPGTLSRVIIYKSKGAAVNRIYNDLISILASGNKDIAVTIATDFINDVLGLPEDIQIRAQKIWAEINSTYS